jgi:ribose-phosphate pyrophosphokinase
MTAKLYSTRAYQNLAEQIADHLNLRLSEVERVNFPDGELYQRVVCSPDSKASGVTVLVSGTHTESTTLELFDLACELANQATSLILFIPYFGYSTMERSVREGEIVTAKTRALLLSAIPQAPLGNRFVFFDLHSPGIPHYLQAGLAHRHLYGKSLIRDICQSWYPAGDFVLASTDSGRAQWVESLAHDIGVESAYILKQRLDGSHTKVKAVQADVVGKKVVIYDDMIRTGSSLLKAAEAYLKAGAIEVSAVATHGVFPPSALERLQSSVTLKRIGITDSHPNSLAAASQFPEFVTLHSCSKLFADYLINCG